MNNSSIRTLILLAILLLPATAGRAVDRSLSIFAPEEAAPGAVVETVVSASTNGDDNEEVGFLHAEYSIDNGKTWTGYAYLEKCGASVARKVGIKVGPLGSRTLIRVRAAFRGGQAGDVDFKGAPIQWNGTWSNWRTPPTRFAIIYVRKL